MKVQWTDCLIYLYVYMQLHDGLFLCVQGKLPEDDCKRTEAEPTGDTAVGLLSMTCSAHFLIQPRPACPGMALSTVGWALPRQSLNPINALQTHPQASLMEAVSQLRFPLHR